jgi:hypothetical protein
MHNIRVHVRPAGRLQARKYVVQTFCLRLGVELGDDIFQRRLQRSKCGGILRDASLGGRYED